MPHSHPAGMTGRGVIVLKSQYPENSLAAVGSHGGRSGPMAEVTRPCDVDHILIPPDL